ncbi:NAD(P)/FAD-dependent oxidoreductase [Enterococcus sp. 669A]|uniref:NAD(P)/FAD-dependent oxidoreductase n=1 Tax=Candidatus Enterococcus moelleringii TaxID=2815325 RepID=A0ABS3LFU0_9ENTE|nr:FAD/NAD(P)-binding oxidoreductase [Enterococcus sp. 669A]MBO1308485.1 NAD(P)/FAD-dependent oxidoreductase [Enterococcus sp. 669A]
MIVIIGGSFAGVQAALELRRLNKQQKIVIYEKETYLGYVPNGLNEFLKGKINSLEEAILYDVAELKSKQIDVHLGSECTFVDPAAKELTIVKAGQAELVSYDQLIVAAGSIQRPLALEQGTNLVYQTKTLADAQQTLDKLQGDVSSVAVLGGGIIGIELASALRQFKPELQITILEKFDRLLELAVDEVISSAITEKLQESNIQLHTGIDFESIHEDAQSACIRTNEGSFKTDMIIKAPNLEPNHQILEDAITLDIDGSSIVNRNFQAEDSIYVLGDLLRLTLMPIKEKFYMPLINNSVRTALVAADHISGKKELTFESTKTNVFAAFGMTVVRSGAQKRNERFTSYHINKCNGVYSLPGKDSPQVYVVIFVREDNHQILGIQAASEADISPFANLFSLVIRGKLTVEELATHDFFFHAAYPSKETHCLNEIALDYLYNEEKR